MQGAILFMVVSDFYSPYTWDRKALPCLVVTDYSRVTFIPVPRNYLELSLIRISHNICFMICLFGDTTGVWLCIIEVMIDYSDFSHYQHVLDCQGCELDKS